MGLLILVVTLLVGWGTIAGLIYNSYAKSSLKNNGHTPGWTSTIVLSGLLSPGIVFGHGFLIGPAGLLLLPSAGSALVLINIISWGIILGIFCTIARHVDCQKAA